MKKLFYLLLFFSLFFGQEAAGKSGPNIRVDSNYWDFGKIEESQRKEKIFTVENVGNEDLVIEKVYTTCGCTTAEISSNRIPPGVTAELKVIYNPQGKQPGKDEKYIYLVSNDLSQPKLKFSISAEIGSKASFGQKNISKIPSLSSTELYERLRKEQKIAILDVREENEYIERHIPEAVWFPKSRFDRNDESVLAKLQGIDKETLLVSYCGAGHRSSYITKKLRQKGYKAYNLDGISFWEKKGYPLIRGPKLPASQEPAIVHLEEAYEHYFLLFRDIIWVDVRNKEDYLKGHVKGALGIPLSDLEYNLDKISPDKEVVFYCEGTWDGGKCDASMSAGRILIKNGFKPGRIKVFEDGFGAWENAGYPVEGGENDE